VTNDESSDAEKVRALAHELVKKHDGAWAFELLRVALFREAYDSGFTLKLRVSRMSAKERARVIPLRKGAKQRDDVPRPLKDE
jgi:hypothetical protein